jgi:Ca2+/Na+ antiporter
MESAMRRLRSGNLTQLLVVVSILEFVVNRLAARLFFPRPALASGGSGATAIHAISWVGSWLFQLTALLALAVLVAAFIGLFRRGELYPRSIRFSTAFIATGFAALVAWAVFTGSIDARFFVWAQTCYAFLTLLTAIAFVTTSAPVRTKIGVAMLALPGTLHAFGYAASRLTTSGQGAISGARGTLALGGPALLEGGAIAVLLAGLLAPLLLPPRPIHERRWHVPLAIATALTALFVFALVWRFDLIQASALYGLRLELPPLTSFAGMMHVLAFFGWTFATIELIADRGGIRLAGYGMVLLALGGYEQASPVELSLSVLGIVAVAVGELRALPYADRNVPRIGVPEWRAFLKRLAEGVDDGTGPTGEVPRAVFVAEGELEVSRIQAHRRTQPVLIKLMRKRGAPTELDATFGNAGHAAADASIERHRRWLARNPDQKVRLPRTKTGDPSFDHKFSVHGTAPLEDAEMRRRLERQQGDGVLTIWRGSAARYQLSHPGGDAPVAFAGQVDGTAPVQSIVDIVDMLADLVDASTPATG